MIRLKITKKDGYVYELEDEKQKQYELRLDFIDIDVDVQENDTIEMEKELFHVGKNTTLVFGKMNSPYGREKVAVGDIDVIILQKEKKDILLKRLYG